MNTGCKPARILPGPMGEYDHIKLANYTFHLIFAPPKRRHDFINYALKPNASKGAVAQLVEQRTENPCVGGSIPPHTTF
jgi:hypothetical protein